MGEYNLSEEEIARYGGSAPFWWHENFRELYLGRGREERAEGVFRFVVTSVCSTLFNGLEGALLGMFISLPFRNPVPPHETAGKIMLASTCIGAGYGLLKRPALMIYQGIRKRKGIK